MAPSSMTNLERSSVTKVIKTNREEDPLVLNQIENILLYRRGWITRKPVQQDVVFIYSGGLDSTITIDMIINEWQVSRIFPLFIRRNAKATKFEEAAVNYFLTFYQLRYPHRIMPLEIVETEVPPYNFKNYNFREKDRPKGHPMRNFILQFLGMQYAHRLRGENTSNTYTVLTATVGDDTFPHSSLVALRSATLSACLDAGDWNWQITSPLIDTGFDGRPIFKRELIKYAQKKHIPLEYTRSCIEGDETPDGTCGECLCRLKAFSEAGIIDPVNYRNNK